MAKKVLISIAVLLGTIFTISAVDAFILEYRREKKAREALKFPDKPESSDAGMLGDAGELLQEEVDTGMFGESGVVRLVKA